MHRLSRQPARDGGRERLRGGGVHGLDDSAVGAGARRPQGHVAAVGAVAAEEARGGVEVAPAGRGELRRVRHHPRVLADRVGARPRLRRERDAHRGERNVRRDRRDHGPVDVGRHLAIEVSAVDPARQIDAAEVVIVRTVLAGPDLLARRDRVGRARTVALCAAVAAHVVRAEHVDRGRERGVADHLVGRREARVIRDHLNIAVAAAVQRGAQVLVPGLVESALVPAAEVVDGEAVAVLGTVEEAHIVVDHVGGEERAVADPARCSPGQRIELDRRIARLGLFHQPPFVTAIAVEIARGVLVALLGAAGRVGVAAGLDLEDLHGGTDAGLEQIIQDLGALRLRIVEQQPAVAAAAGDRADAVEHATGGIAVDRDGGRDLVGVGLLRRDRRRGIETRREHREARREPTVVRNHDVLHMDNFGRHRSVAGRREWRCGKLPSMETFYSGAPGCKSARRTF